MLTLTSGPLLVLFPVTPVFILCFFCLGQAQVSLCSQHLLPPLEPVLTTYNTNNHIITEVPMDGALSCASHCAKGLAWCTG